jgi:hypothetical protein
MCGTVTATTFLNFMGLVVFVNGGFDGERQKRAPCKRQHWEKGKAYFVCVIGGCWSARQCDVSLGFDCLHAD